MNFKEFSLALLNYDTRKINFVALGNKLRGDDGIASFFLTKLRKTYFFKDSNFIDVGTNPENYFSKLLSNNPDLILFIDAADFGGYEGQISWLENSKIDEIDISTHAFSIKLVQDFILSQKKVDFKYLGIQPHKMEFNTPISQKVMDSVNSFFSIQSKP